MAISREMVDISYEVFLRISCVIVMFKRLSFLAMLWLLSWSYSLGHALDLDDLMSKLEFLTERDTVISQNIANSDTPGYKAKEILPERSNNVSLLVTAPGHISIEDSGEYRVVHSKATSMKPNKNNVDRDNELMKKAENARAITVVASLQEEIRKMNEMIINNAKLN